MVATRCPPSHSSRATCHFDLLFPASGSPAPMTASPTSIASQITLSVGSAQRQRRFSLSPCVSPVGIAGQSEVPRWQVARESCCIASDHSFPSCETCKAWAAPDPNSYSGLGPPARSRCLVHSLCLPPVYISVWPQRPEITRVSFYIIGELYCMSFTSFYNQKSFFGPLILNPKATWAYIEMPTYYPSLRCSAGENSRTHGTIIGKQKMDDSWSLSFNQNN